MGQAYDIVARQVQQQASMLAYIDVFWLLAIVCACMVPFVFLMKPNKPGAGPAAAPDR